jgi:hypothetical protein
MHVCAWNRGDTPVCVRACVRLHVHAGSTGKEGVMMVSFLNLLRVGLDSGLLLLKWRAFGFHNISKRLFFPVRHVRTFLCSLLTCSCPDIQVNYGGVATHNSPHIVFVSEPANAANVHIFGPGVEKGVKCNTPTHFNIDCRDAGQGILYYMKWEVKQVLLYMIMVGFWI